MASVEVDPRKVKERVSRSEHASTAVPGQPFRP